MVIVQLTGGLGNQLFQYCSAKALAKHHNTELILDVSSFHRSELPDLEVARNFDLANFEEVTETIIKVENKTNNPLFNFIKESKFDKLIPNYKRNVYKERYYHFDLNFFRSKKNVYLKGGWQSYKYFKNIEHELLKKMKLKEKIVAPINTILRNYEHKNTLSIHIRRGDYLRKPIILEWHGVLDISYFLKAYEEISKKTTIDQVIYFTDDTKWVEKELIPFIPGKIFSNNLASNQFTDFYLMQHCKHNIIANSSFSWWAAYLNPNPNKIVIAPKKWFNKAPCNTKDLYPEGWIKI